MALLASVSFVGFDIVRKRLSALDAMAVTGTLSLAQGTLFAAWWALEANAGGHGLRLPQPGYLVPGAVCAVLNVIAGVLFVRSLALSPFSRTIPLLSLSPVFAAAGAAILLREVPSLLQGAAIAMTVWGALWINADRATGVGLRSLLQAVYQERGSFLMVVVACLWSLTLVLDKKCLEFADPAGHAALQNFGVAGVLAIVLPLSTKGATGKVVAVFRRGGAVCVAAFLGTAALGFQLLALGLLFAAVVETIKRGIGVVGSLLVGRLAFGEPLTPHKLFGALLIVAGTSVLAFAHPL